jgi:hypothetical protein
MIEPEDIYRWMLPECLNILCGGVLTEIGVEFYDDSC